MALCTTCHHLIPCHCHHRPPLLLPRDLVVQLHDILGRLLTEEDPAEDIDDWGDAPVPPLANCGHAPASSLPTGYSAACTQAPDHTGPHAAPLIADGEQVGAMSWDDPDPGEGELLRAAEADNRKLRDRLDRVMHYRDVLKTELARSRETVRRLNYRAQLAESELATYRRAVGQWEINDRGTYIPHASLRAIGKAAGRDILGSVRHLQHFQRVEQAEATLAELTEARQHGAFTYCPQDVGHVTVEAFARKIAEKRQAIAERDQAVRDAQGFLDRATRAEAVLARVRDVIADMRDITGARHWADAFDTALDGPPDAAP